MAKSNAIGWFDIYVSDMGRAVAFYERVLQQKFGLSAPCREACGFGEAGDNQERSAFQRFRTPIYSIPNPKFEKHGT